jgi:hypothetical protein
MHCYAAISFTMASTAAMASGVITRCAWRGRGEYVTELTPFRNFLLRSYTCCSDRHASPYRTSIRRWISMGFNSSLRKKSNERKLFLFGACCKWGRHLYTIAAPSCCVPLSYCHLSATLQTMSTTVARGQSSSVSNFYHAFNFFHLTQLRVCVCVCVYIYIYIYIRIVFSLIV